MNSLRIAILLLVSLAMLATSHLFASTDVSNGAQASVTVPLRDGNAQAHRNLLKN